MGCSSFVKVFSIGCVYHTREQPVSYNLERLEASKQGEKSKPLKARSRDNDNHESAK